MRSTNYSRMADLLYQIFLFRPTRSCLPKLSAGFQKPFRSLTRSNAYVSKALREKYIKEQAVKTDTDGKKPRLLYVTPKAGEACPDLKELADYHLHQEALPSFKPVPINETEHQLGLAEFGAELYASIADLPTPIRLLNALPTGHFQAFVDVYDRHGRIKAKKAQIIPDFTLAFIYEGKAFLYFIELQHQTGVIIPRSGKSINRSFQHKLSKYKAFSRFFRLHPVIQRMEQAHGYKFSKFRVLIPTIRRSQTHLENLMAANTSKGFDETFFFGRLEALEGKNVLLDSCWQIRGGRSISLLDFLLK